MQMKLEGPGTANLLTKLAGLVEAGTEACQAYAQGRVQDMKAKDMELQELHRRRQRLENEVKQLEERKKKALGQPVAKPVERLKGGTKPLTAEEQAAHRAKGVEDRDRRKAEVEAKREAPLTHQPFAALAEIEGSEEAPQQET